MKSIKRFKMIPENMLILFGGLVLVYAIYLYSNNKNMHQLGMSSLSDSQSIITNPSVNLPTENKVMGVANPSTYAPFNGASQSTSNSATTSDSMNKPVANPADLLPSDANSSWASMNPVGDLQNINLLNPQQVVGINTQGSSLRNANLQLRSEPPNPRTNTSCPWNISTIEDDKFRKPLEIGTGA